MEDLAMRMTKMWFGLGLGLLSLVTVAVAEQPNDRAPSNSPETTKPAEPTTAPAVSAREFASFDDLMLMFTIKPDPAAPKRTFADTVRLKPVGYWTAMLNREEPWERMFACEALACFGKAAAAAVPDLQRAANDKTIPTQGPIGASLRVVASHAIFNITEDSTALSKVVDGFDAADPTVRSLAAMVLAIIGPQAKAATPRLLGLMTDQDLGVRVAAMEAMGKIGVASDDVVRSLRLACDHPKERIRESAAVALGRLGAGAKGAVPTLLVLLHDPDGTVRVAAAEALWYIERHPAAMSLLLAALSTDTPTEPPVLVTVPPRFPGDVFHQEYVQVDDHLYVQVHAIAAIQRMGPTATQAVSALRVLSKQAWWPAHIQAAVALGAIDPKEDPLPTLLASLKSDQYAVRADAASALREIGAPARVATPALLDAMKLCAADARNVPNRSVELGRSQSDSYRANGYDSLCRAWFAELNVLRDIDPDAAAKYEAGEDFKSLTEYNRREGIRGAAGSSVPMPPIPSDAPEQSHQP
jgi:HEAT repeat protein